MGLPKTQAEIIATVRMALRTANKRAQVAEDKGDSVGKSQALAEAEKAYQCLRYWGVENPNA